MGFLWTESKNKYLRFYVYHSIYHPSGMPTLTEQVVVSCEHGGNEIPDRLTTRFENHQDLLQSHYGWDPGALAFAQKISSELHAPLIFQTVSRLVVECNRTINHPQLWSNVTGSLPAVEKNYWLEEIYLPYREQLRAHIAAKASSGLPAIHLSSHSMTHQVGDSIRHMDVALLFDPKRPYEQAFCEAWGKQLHTMNANLVVAYNEPYQGYNDGQVTWLRGMFDGQEYIGIELELNQKHVDTERWEPLMEVVSGAFQKTLATFSLS